MPFRPVSSLHDLNRTLRVKFLLDLRSRRTCKFSSMDNVNLRRIESVQGLRRRRIWKKDEEILKLHVYRVTFERSGTVLWTR